MMYGCWDNRVQQTPHLFFIPHISYMVPEIWSATDRIFLSSWVIFCPFTPLTAPKMKISNKWRKLLEISSFYTIAPKKYDHMLYCSWDRCNCYSSFWAFFHPFTSLTPQKMKISKNEKNPRDIIISHKWFHHFTHFSRVLVLILPIFWWLLLRNDKILSKCFETSEHSMQTEADNSKLTSKAF